MDPLLLASAICFAIGTIGICNCLIKIEPPDDNQDS